MGLSRIGLLIAGIPEPIGVLIFGIVLIAVAVAIRKMAARIERTEENEKAVKKA